MKLPYKERPSFCPCGHTLSYSWIVIGAICLSIAWAPSEAAEAQCRKAAPAQVTNDEERYTIGQGWAGTFIGYEGVSDGKNIYVAYYDADRWLTVASLDAKDGRLCRIRLDSQFEGWDSHRKPELTIDNEGVLHVAANMHDSKLVYGRGTAPGTIDGLKLTSMTGRDEDRVTYPQFLHSKSGELLFFYRHGQSGNGLWYVNKLVDGKWERLNQHSLYQSTWQGEPVSAYPSSPFLDANGDYHIAIVWRRTPDVSTNFMVSYVRTPDFTNFYSASGEKLSLPISPDSRVEVDAPGPSRGLINNARVVAEENGTPIVFYTKYDPSNHNAVYAAKFDEMWSRHLVISTHSHIPVRGGGAHVSAIGLGSPTLAQEKDAVSISIRLGDKGSRPYLISTRDFSILRSESHARNDERRSAYAPPIPRGLDRSQRASRPVYFQDGDHTKKVAELKYFSQTANRDKPRNCTSKAPKACRPPPTPLDVVVFSDR